MLTKGQLAEAIAATGAGSKRQVLHMLDSLAEVAWDEVNAGEDFTVPGVARISYTYRAPVKKGDKYKKGETYVGFGGVETVAEADSKPVTEMVKLRAAPTGSVAKLKPKTAPEAQREFMKGKVGKAVRKRKAK